MKSFNILDPSTDIDQNLLIEASAGCGKTFAIERLVVRLLEKGIPLKKMVIVTFTKKGAADLRARILSHLQSIQSPFLQQFDEASIYTIHSFALTLLKEDLLEGKNLFQTLVDEEGLQSIVDDFIETHCSLALLQELLLTQTLPELRRALLKGEWMAESFLPYLEEIKEREDFFTYDDLLVHLKRRIEAHPEIYRARFSVGIMDEFQDTDPLQWEIFSKLFLHPAGRLYLVGDPKQSIYAFRDADIYTYMQAEQQFSEKRTLSVNYRSDPTLLKGLNTLFEAAGPFLTLPKLHQHLEFVPVSVPEGKKDAPQIGGWDKIQFFAAQDKELFLPWIAARLVEFHKAGTPLGEMAILVDTNDLAKQAFDYLKECRIPCLLLNNRSEETAESEKALQKVRLATEHPQDEGKLLGALLTPFFGWTFQAIDRLKDEKFKEKIIWSFMSLQKSLENGRQPFIGALLELKIEAKTVLETLLGYCFGPEWMGELNKQESPKDLRAPEPTPPKTQVPILTMHVAKGLEFEVVFPLGLAQRRRKKEGDSEETEAEKMRLLYVALTRAKRQLFIPILLSKRRKDLHSLIEIFLSRFIPEIHVESLSQRFSVTVVQSAEEVFFPIPAVPPMDPPPPLTTKIDLKELFSFTKLLKLIPPVEKKEAWLSEKETHLVPGKATGEFMHAILEKIPLELVKRAEKAEDLLPFVATFTQKTRWETAEKEICDLLFAAFNLLFFRQVNPEKSWREVEFVHPIAEGFMRGVIDWFFEHEGLYYVVDWKTNTLSDYSQESILRCMEEHGYTLQAEIYYEAAKRYLRQFGDFKIGGVYFVFLRGAAACKAI